LESEDVLHRYDVALEPPDLTDLSHAARAILESFDVNNEIERRHELLADRA
jgi:hypothetical protein